MKNKLEKFGSFGAIVAAAACPICFPKLALFGALFGFSVLVKYEAVFFFGVQFLVVLAVIGHVFSFKKHQNRKLLFLVFISTILFFISLYAFQSEILSYVAFSGLIVATIWVVFENRKCFVCVRSE